MTIPPDPLVTTGVGLILGLAHASKDAVTDIVKRLFGPTADVAGDRLARLFFERRAERATEGLENGAKMLPDGGEEPQAVPGRILMPILEHCFVGGRSGLTTAMGGTPCECRIT